ncbi:MAG: pitrilysin family protein [Methylococcaceae bacterium]
MNFKRYFTVVLVVFSSSSFAAAKIENWQTQKGSRVYFVQTDALPMVDIQVIFDAGSARDGEKFGLSSFTTNLLDSGAGKWNAEDIAQRFESVGANFGTASSIDNASVTLRTLTDKPLFDKAIDTMRVILGNPTFAKNDFTREKNRTLVALKQREESPGDLANLTFYKAIYGEHPYAHPNLGILQTVEKFTEKDVKNFYKSYFTASNAIVVIVGNLSKLDAENTANLLVSDLPQGEKPAPLPDVPALKKSTTQNLDFPSTQTHVLVGLTGTYRKDPDYFPLYVGNHILGGGSLVSKLFDEVREKRGLAYSASSGFMPLLKNGVFVASLQTRNDQTAQALEVLNQTLADFVKNGVTDTELTAAKNNIVGGFPLKFDSNKELVNYVSMIGFYQMPLDYLDTFQQNVQNVTKEQIADAFKRRVDLNLLQTVTVGKK